MCVITCSYVRRDYSETPAIEKRELMTGIETVFGRERIQEFRKKDNSALVVILQRLCARLKQRGDDIQVRVFVISFV